MFFATPTSSNGVCGLPSTEPPSLCVDLSSVRLVHHDIDASAAVALAWQVIDGLRARNIGLHVARATVELQLRFDEVELTAAIGADHFHG